MPRGPDEPLDTVQEALVRMFVRMIVHDLRAELAAEAAADADNAGERVANADEAD